METIHESPRQWRGEQDTGPQTRARHAAAVSIPSTCAIEPWSIRPTVAARIERVHRGGTANSCLDRTCECDKRRGNEPEQKYRSAHLRDERSTPSQSETTRAMNAVVKRAEVVMRPPRTTTVKSDRREHLWLDLDNIIQLN
jgi:hypothetical protein